MAHPASPERRPEEPSGPDAQLLAEIESLLLASKQAAHGATAGMHRSRRRGTSSEFSEHKLYTPGDDVRHIDWRAYAKTDRFHVKQFEDETNLRVELLVDHSGSMAFTGEEPGATPRPTKLAYAKVLAGALSYLALRQGDATGLITFASEISDDLPPRATSSHLMEILTRLTRLAPSTTTGIVRSLDRFAQTQKRRTVTVLISDLFDPSPDLRDSFRRLAARRHDVVVLHVLDGAEIEFPYENPSTFVSMEDDRRLFVHPRTLRAAYVSEMKKFLADTARFMAECRIDYRLVDTRQQAGLVLGEFLRARQARR
jgi:uncharacterized protein (DUF58 family)